MIFQMLVSQLSCGAQKRHDGYDFSARCKEQTQIHRFYVLNQFHRKRENMKVYQFEFPAKLNNIFSVLFFAKKHFLL